MKVSIVIPVYEMKGMGASFIKKNLEFISKQTYKNTEIIISDHSLNDDIKNVCESFKDLNIKYFKNHNKIGSSSSNLNFAISKSTGKLIKILMQDDFLIDQNGITKIVEIYNNTNFKWLVNGCNYGSDYLNPKGGMIPYYDDEKIKNGKNTISAPSVVTISNDSIEYFDETLIWMMDCDYYKRLYEKYGSPYILSDKIVFISQHKNQISNWLDNKIKISEEEKIKQKY